MSNPLKILVITNLYPPQTVGGYERSIADFSRLLHDRGHRISVLTSQLTDQSSVSLELSELLEVRRELSLCGEWTEHGYAWFPPDRLALTQQQNRQVVDAVLQAFQPQVCLAGNIDLLGVDLLQQVMLSNVPVVHYVMNETPNYPPEDAPHSSLHCYVTCSNWVKQTMQQYGYPVETATTIYPGAAVEAFYQAELPLHDHLRIAYASLVMHYKGADVLVEALSLLHAAGVKVTATIAGGTFYPKYVEMLQQFIESEGLQSQVQFAGVLSRQELSQLYKTHNVLVFPSRFQEPFGISQIEAMAAGLTLVTSGTGGACEIVEHGYDGLVFESENPLDLADALSSLPAHPAEWETLTRRGQQKALTQFSQAHAVAVLERILQERVDMGA